MSSKFKFSPVVQSENLQESDLEKSYHERKILDFQSTGKYQFDSGIGEETVE